MNDEVMRVLQMLEDGKINAGEARQLLEVINRTGAQKKSEPEPADSTSGVGVPLPDIAGIVSQALREAFSEVERELSQLNISEMMKATGTVTAQGARFAGAKLSNTNLMDAKMDAGTRFEGANLRGAVFVDADLRGADLRGANLAFSNFTDANLKNADLRGANMSHSNFVDANFLNADMRGANLSHGAYTDANFSDCDLRKADLSRSKMVGANFHGVRQPGLTLRGVRMPGVKFTGGQAPEGQVDESGLEDEAPVQDMDAVQEVVEPVELDTEEPPAEVENTDVPPESTEEDAQQPQRGWPWTPRRGRSKPSS